MIQARWNQGFRVDDFKKVIDNRVSYWKDDPSNEQYLRPETLFGNKFEGYLNAPMKSLNPQAHEEQAAQFKEYEKEVLNHQAKAQELRDLLRDMPQGHAKHEKFKTELARHNKAIIFYEKKLKEIGG